MDQDQFGGRTDDDLFSDDIEPVEEEETFDLPEAAPVPTHDPPAQPEPTPAPAVVKPTPAPPVVQPPRSSLAQSRHAPKPRPDANPPRSSHKNNNHNNNHNNHNKPKSPKPPPSVSSDAPSTQETTTTAAPANAPTAPSGKQPPTGPRETSASSTTTTTNSSTAGTPQPGNNNGGGGGNTASAVSHARLSSGANPRTKLTDTELAARMERMRVVAAEKTRRFEEAQRDESEHAVAYARGMEEARRRRAEDAARRKAADEERRKLDDERARNRERKLKAMEMKEGGWDEGKAEREAEGGKRGFKGAHGGVRGARSGAPGGGGSGGGGGGLGGSRFANPNPGPVDEAGEFDGFGIRGRGGGFRGRGGRGRGGRGGGRALFDEREGEHNRDQGRQGGPAASAPPPPKKADLKKEDFPALPSSAAAPKKVDTAWVPKPGATDYPVTSPLGKWDEEVAATLDANQTPS